MKRVDITGLPGNKLLTMSGKALWYSPVFQQRYGLGKPKDGLNRVINVMSRIQQMQQKPDDLSPADHLTADMAKQAADEFIKLAFTGRFSRAVRSAGNAVQQAPAVVRNAPAAVNATNAKRFARSVGREVLPAVTPMVLGAGGDLVSRANTGHDMQLMGMSGAQLGLAATAARSGTRLLTSPAVRRGAGQAMNAAGVDPAARRAVQSGMQKVHNVAQAASPVKLIDKGLSQSQKAVGLGGRPITAGAGISNSLLSTSGTLLAGRAIHDRFRNDPRNILNLDGNTETTTPLEIALSRVSPYDMRNTMQDVGTAFHEEMTSDKSPLPSWINYGKDKIDSYAKERADAYLQENMGINVNNPEQMKKLRGGVNFLTGGAEGEFKGLRRFSPMLSNAWNAVKEEFGSIANFLKSLRQPEPGQPSSGGEMDAAAGLADASQQPPPLQEASPTWSPQDMIGYLDFRDAQRAEQAERANRFRLEPQS